MKAIKQNGFSLTEVLMAVGILSVGMMLIATMFPVGIYLTSVAAERTMAAIVADEAFAKIKLYGIEDPYHNPNFLLDYEYELVSAGKIDPNEFLYPSIDPLAGNKQYCWSALCKLIDDNDTEYLVTVFVARKISPNLKYPYAALSLDYPRAVPVQVVYDANIMDNRLTISDSGRVWYVNPPTTVVYNISGRIYRIVDRVGDVIALDRNWVEDMNSYIPPRNFIWLIPPPETGGRNADVEVFQRIIRF